MRKSRVRLTEYSPSFRSPEDPFFISEEWCANNTNHACASVHCDSVQRVVKSELVLEKKPE